MARDDGGGDSGQRRGRVRQQNARSYARSARRYNKPENSTTGAYDVASRSGPRASHYPVPDYINKNRRGRGQVGRGPYGPPKLATPEGSTTGVYDVASRSGPGARPFPYGDKPRGDRTLNWRSPRSSQQRPPKSEQRFNLKRAANNRLARG